MLYSNILIVRLSYVVLNIISYENLIHAIQYTKNNLSTTYKW